MEKEPKYIPPPLRNKSKELPLKEQYPYTLSLEGSQLLQCRNNALHTFNVTAGEDEVPEYNNPEGYLTILIFNKPNELQLGAIQENLTGLLPQVQRLNLLLRFKQPGVKTTRIFLCDGLVMNENTILKQIRDMFAARLLEMGCTVRDNFQPYLSLYNQQIPLGNAHRNIIGQLVNWNQNVPLTGVNVDVFEDN